MPLRLRLRDPLPFIRNELSPLSVVFLLQQGERDLPEVSRRDLDLLIAEEDEAILREQGRPIWECGVWLVLGSQAPGMGSGPISPLLHSES